ncbi:SDR family oxidoreductase [Mesorhizobium sp. J428]|uniref:SDR family oxidoreductase n=1 Tax=Mesorhizobium sp. J428 TaxID=2898440 RepID=UPI002150A269|nr:SDR family oxidoreductase [Mesorhizobium sp. J428]MCR5859138.1 SDR family oxidoreductase [Mesorhizobium sp. J428]
MIHQPRVALVTGGARRIGAAIVRDLARNGFAVAIHCNRSRTEAEALAADIVGDGGRAAVVTADLTKADQADDLVARATAQVGPLGLLVNSASIFEPDEIGNFGWELWDAHFAVHVKAPVLLARRFAESLPPDTAGLVVNIIDERVWRPNPQFFSYTLSKSALWDATRTMAQALAPRIRVNAIGPGPTLPNIRQQPGDFERQIAGLLLERGPRLPEFGATVRYLFETMSVTGQMIAIDGGQHLAWETPDVTGMRE